ncbi:unnamed protein product [Parascedosporium putredinis]|uniref:Rab-GAP TBC domain-containing protein n=1 Tax=Parascedosporium putredinis TaxID=1442378 RepID=A0A9P1H0I9_9PEZI|nr:unnamed protein product [Parascedosporium putredinis]CAI7992870.1 unnamed protein product [Parascedosporium putredinis]
MPLPGEATRPLLPPLATELQPPPSPRTHRTLRRLQSAHTLGSKASSQASLITQQRLREQHQQLQNLPQRSASPVKRDVSGGYANRSPQKQRERASSDAANKHHIHPVALGGSGATASTVSSRQHHSGQHQQSIRKTPLAHANLSLQQLVRDGPPDGDLVGALEAARYKILDEGIKSDSDGMSSLRIYVWLILLDAPILSTDDYLALIHRGASPAYSKIRNDTFRTLTTDPLFRRRVSEASLIRLLNAIAWKLHDAREAGRRERPMSSRSSLAPDNMSLSGGLGGILGGGLSGGGGGGSDSRPVTAGSSPAAKNRARALTLTTESSETSHAPESGTYVQGMNVLAAPFLYAARSEAEAFIGFHTLLTRECPGYIRGAMDGVHKGLALVDKVLAIVDPKLSLYLTSRGLKAEIYAFPSLHLMRDKILKSPSPGNLLRSLPALQADLIKRVSITILQRIPRDVYAEIVSHAQ